MNAGFVRDESLMRVILRCASNPRETVMNTGFVRDESNDESSCKTANFVQ